MKHSELIKERINENYDRLFFTDDHKKLCSPYVCVICDIFISPQNLNKITLDALEKCCPFLHPPTQRQIHPTIKTFYTLPRNQTHNNLNVDNMYLSPRATLLYNHEDHREKPGYSVCKTCLASLEKQKMPMYAIANNYMFGEPPTCLKCLTDVELALITPVKTHGYCFCWRGGTKKVLKGNLSYFSITTAQISNIVQCFDTLGLNKNVIVLLYGKMTPDQRKKARNKASIRTHCVKDAVQWLQQNNEEWNKDRVSFKTVTDLRPIIVDKSILEKSEDLQQEQEETFEVYYPDGTITSTKAGHQDMESFKETLFNAIKKKMDINLRCPFPKTRAVDYKDNTLVNSCLLQYPYGVGGIHETRLTQKGILTANMDILDYVKHVINLSQPQFHHDLFILIMYNFYVKQKMLKAAYWKVRGTIDANVLGSDLKPEDVHNAINARSKGVISMDDSAKRGMKFIYAIDAMAGNVPHTNQATKTAKHTAEAIQHHFGCPTYFLTVTPDDDNSFFMQVFSQNIIDTNEKVGSLSEQSLYDRAKLRSSLRLAYPGIAALQFEYFLNIIIEEVIGWDRATSKPKKETKGLFGQVQACCLTVEEQGRKTLHAHILIWVKELNEERDKIHSMVIGRSGRAMEKITKQIDKIASCSLLAANKSQTAKVLSIATGHNCRPDKKCKTVITVSNQQLRHLRYSDTTRDTMVVAFCTKCGEEFTMDSILEGHLVKNIKVKGLTHFPDLAERRLKAWAISYQKPYQSVQVCSEIIDASYNYHIHTDSCFKANLKKTTHKKRTISELYECRYQFPKPPQTTTTINKVHNNTVIWSKWNGSRENRFTYEVNLRRSELDPFINVSCPSISLSKMTCNTNLAFIMPGTTAQYIFKYVVKNTQEDDTKGYKEVKEVVEKAFANKVNDTNKGRALQRILRSSFAHQNNNVISAPMASYIIRTDSRFYFSHDTFWCPLIDIFSLLTGDAICTTLDIGFNSTYFKNSAMHYVCRPDELENMSPFEFYQQYDVVKQQKTRSDNQLEFTNKVYTHPSYDNKKQIFRQRVRKRPKICLLKVHQYLFPDTANFGANILENMILEPTEAMEKYCKMCILLLHSYRTLEDITPTFTYTEMLRKLYLNNKISSEGICFLQNIQDAKSNSFRNIIDGDFLQRHTDPKLTTSQVRKQLSKKNDELTVPEDQLKHDICNLPSPDMFSGPNPMPMIPQSISLQCIRHNGRLNCGYSMLADQTITDASNQVYQIQQTESFSPSIQVTNSIPKVKYPFSHTVIMKIILTKSGYSSLSLPELFPESETGNILQANGTSASIIDWSEKSKFDMDQRRAFEIISSAFVLSYYAELSARCIDTNIILSNEHKKLEELCDNSNWEDKRQLIAFLDGPAGSGKSSIIEMVLQYAKEYCSFMDDFEFDNRTIVLTALTGVAATMIQGETTHSALYLNQRKELSHEQKEKWLNTKLVIIDEISFASSNDIIRIDDQLRKLTDKMFLKFGGLSIVFSGDFRQLEPIGKDQRPIYTENIQQFKDWTNCYIALQGIHRFKSDPKWGKLLLRFRSGCLTQQDLLTINRRVVTQSCALPNDVKYATYFNVDRDAINTALFSTRSENNFRQFRQTADSLFIFASDIEIMNSSKLYSTFQYADELYQHCSEDNFRFSWGSQRMDPVLKLYTGCKLMIPTNSDVEAGIANGTQAILLKVALKPGTMVRTVCVDNTFNIKAVFASDVEHLLLQHENIRRNPLTFQITPIQHKFKLKVSNKSFLYDKVIDASGFMCPMRATQLPIVLNNATTGHKLQGSSVDNLFVHQWNYTTNWVYVVLSRVRTIQGLFLRQPLNLDLTKYSVHTSLTEMLSKMIHKKPKSLSKADYKRLK